MNRPKMCITLCLESTSRLIFLSLC